VAPIGAGAGTALAACSNYPSPPNLFTATLGGAAFGSWSGPTVTSAAPTVSTLGVVTYLGHLPDRSAVFVVANGASPGILTATLVGTVLSGIDVTVIGTTDGLESGIVADVTGDGVADNVAQATQGGVDVLRGTGGGGYKFASRTPATARVLAPARLYAGIPPDVLLQPLGTPAAVVIPLANDGAGGLR
jgi:hypothetical protein